MAVKQSIMIPEIRIGQFTLRLVGDSPLIVHKWSEKAKREILDKQMKIAKTQRYDIRNPVADFIDSLYWLTPERGSGSLPPRSKPPPSRRGIGRG